MRQLTVLVSLLASVVCAQVRADEMPNIVILLADDMGYGEIQPFSATTKVKTPNLNAMAAQGMKFTSFYGEPRCSMSRASLLTGAYSRRVSIPGALEPTSAIGLNPSEVTLAEICKQRGYATTIIGKWHLGHRSDDFMPLNHGFDSYLGLLLSVDQTIDKKHAIFDPACLFREGYNAVSALVPAPQKLPLMRGTVIVEFPVEQPTLTRRYTNEAVQFITDHQDEPFFLYLPYAAIHAPVTASDEWLGTAVTGLRGDAIQEMDSSVGTILATLANLGLDSNTLVMFMSDNGPPLAGLTGPFTGTKGTCSEGGVRVPCIMRWPGHIPAGAVCNQIAGMPDVLPTVAAILDTALPNVTIDGADISTLMFNVNAGPVRDTQLYYASSGIKAIRKVNELSDWKLFLPEGTATTCKLYNMAVASPERVDLAAANPTIVASLKAECLARDLEIRTNARPAGKVTN